MPSELHKYVHKRLREVFGEPDTTLGRDDDWALKPKGPYRASINLLVNGTATTPAVWVFDPHSKNDGVMRASVNKEEDLVEILKKIEDRLARAGRQPPPPAEKA